MCVQHLWDVCINFYCNNNQCQILNNRPISSTPTTSVVDITPTTAETLTPTDGTAKTNDATDHDGDSDQEQHCPLCGMIPAAVVEEAKCLPKPMQAAFQIPGGCLDNKAKVINFTCNNAIQTQW